MSVGCSVKKKLIHQVFCVESAVPFFSLGHVMAANRRNMNLYDGVLKWFENFIVI